MAARDLLRWGWRGLVDAAVLGTDPPLRRARLGRWLRVPAVLFAVAAFAQTHDDLLLSGAMQPMNGETIGGLPAVNYPIAAAVAFPVVLLPRRPLLAWRITFLVAVAGAVWPLLRRESAWPWPDAQLWVLVLVLFAVALRHPRATVASVALATLLLLGLAAPAMGPVAAAAVAGPVLAAELLRRWADAKERLTEQEKLTKVEMARRAALEERARIARELHDVVAHHMSLIAVRAETAPYRFASVPDDLAREFTGIAENSREALTDMRRLLGVLRSDEPPPTAPQPVLDDLSDLVHAAREAGMDVELSQTVSATSVPGTVGVTAYRIVQEALSNARRHAPGAAVRVTVAVADIVRIDVVNGPGSQDPLGDPNGGTGLAGMRERVAALGGSLTSGPLGDGFAVRAQLPIRSPHDRGDDGD